MYESNLITIQDIIRDKQIFNIPMYQRLYVWGADQIKILLDDLVEACIDNKDVFYLGGTLVIQQTGQNAQPVLDLIDGQQRFTTLWLISIAMQRLIKQRAKGEVNHLDAYRCLKDNDKQISRIQFAIRPEVTEFFEILLNDGEPTNTAKAHNLSQAIQEINGYFNALTNICLTQLSRYILESVQLVLTKVPVQTDLNKLFEVINNRGIQLQHHEILKARLLAKIQDNAEREVYGQMWDACSYMTDYVERNLRATIGIKLTALFNQGHVDQQDLAKPEKVLAALKQLYKEKKTVQLSLNSILSEQSSFAEVTDVNNDVDMNEVGETDRVRSIITFPMLLQHVLRIFLVRHKRPDIQKILDKDLLSIFNMYWLKNDNNKLEHESEVKSFIEILWACRYQFDLHVIKWIIATDGEEECHAIRGLRMNESKGYQRVVRESHNQNSAFAMLQSMLYHSQQLTTHYGLTPLLKFLLDYGSENVQIYLKFLDNYLLCTQREEPLIERTRKFLEKTWDHNGNLQDMQSILEQNQGVSFSHYWFYKLEYILWEKSKDRGTAWQAYRMTAKNSVEHVSPQSPKQADSNQVTTAFLDSFGNLGLVSRSLNSEFSNNTFRVKREKFIEKMLIKIESFKLALIYNNTQWSDDLAQKHCQEMIIEYEEYFKAVDIQVSEVRQGCNG